MTKNIPSPPKQPNVNQSVPEQVEAKPAGVKFYYFYVLFTGAAVMALELDASRFLAPYFGTSMIVWANIIGMILLALSVGYFVGGRIADKHPSRTLLMYFSIAAGVWTASLPLWGHWMFRDLSGGILNTPVVTIVLSLAGILLVFVPPVFLLAMVSPFTIRLTSRTAADAGKVAGNLYAFSTIGSLIGTFGTAFVTIPDLGVVQTLIIWSAVLVCISLAGLWGRGARVPVRTAAVVLTAALAVGDVHASAAVHSPYGQVLWSKDTLYQHVAVVRQGDGSTALIYNEGGGVQSVARPNSALNASDYYDDYLLLPFFTAHPKQIAVLGSAGGTIPHLLAVYDRPLLPGLATTGVEIDPSVIPLDSRYFGLRPGDATLVNADARVFIRDTTQRFDVVIVDAYINQIYIPPHMSTQQFFQEIASHLTPAGIVALNVNATSPNSRLLLAFERTLASVYPDVYRVKARGDFNYLLIGSRTPLSTAAFAKIPASSPLRSVAAQWPTLHLLNPRQYAHAVLLTDNHAPIEMLTDSMIFGYAAQRPQ